MRIRDSGPGWKKFGSVIRDGKKSDPGSGNRKNIPDSQHWKGGKRKWGRKIGEERELRRRNDRGKGVHGK
jgi:hypothetical protein